MKVTLEIEIVGFTVPAEIPDADGELVAIDRIAAEGLAELCDRFRESVFAKAGKVDPKVSGSAAKPAKTRKPRKTKDAPATNQPALVSAPIPAPAPTAGDPIVAAGDAIADGPRDDENEPMAAAVGEVNPWDTVKD